MHKNTRKKKKRHDEFIKKAMSKPRVAREFFQVHLPADILKRVDLTTLKPQKESFIENTLGLSYVDMLFKVRFDDEEGYLYILLEQQSTPDRFMAFRLHRYMVQIYSNHLEKHEEVKYLPLVYPLVFYTGQAQYNTPLTLWELFRKPELARSFFVDPFQLIELHKIKDEELRQHLWSGTMAFVMKHIFARDILPFLKTIEPLLREIGEKNIVYIENVLWYILEKAEGGSAETVVDFFKEVVPEEKRGNVMTLADTLIEKGIHIGEQRGVRLGDQKVEQFQQQIVINMLAKGQSVSLISEVTGLSEEQIKKIRDNHYH